MDLLINLTTKIENINNLDKLSNIYKKIFGKDEWNNII